VGFPQSNKEKNLKNSVNQNKTENLCMPLENRLNLLIYKAHKELTFHSKGEENLYKNALKVVN